MSRVSVPLKILLCGVCATAVRVVGQLLIPPGEQTALSPSVFAENGTMPLMFTLYGTMAYSLIAALFLLLRIGGGRVKQGLKYGTACCAVWVVYLCEPLPHVSPLDRITYLTADSLALVAMGAMLGLLLGVPGVQVSEKRPKLQILPVLAITGCFFAGRLAQYLVFDIYSSFDSLPAETLLWSLSTGIVVALTTEWLCRHVRGGSRVKRALVLGGLLFGVDLTLFNFFMPLVFSADIADLILRTAVDVAAVTAGCLFFRQPAVKKQNGGNTHVQNRGH